MNRLRLDKVTDYLAYFDKYVNTESALNRQKPVAHFLAGLCREIEKNMKPNLEFGYLYVEGSKSKNKSTVSVNYCDNDDDLNPVNLLTYTENNRPDKKSRKLSYTDVDNRISGIPRYETTHYDIVCSDKSDVYCRRRTLSKETEYIKINASSMKICGIILINGSFKFASDLIRVFDETLWPYSGERSGYTVKMRYFPIIKREDVGLSEVKNPDWVSKVPYNKYTLEYAQSLLRNHYENKNVTVETGYTPRSMLSMQQEFTVDEVHPDEDATRYMLYGMMITGEKKKTTSINAIRNYVEAVIFNDGTILDNKDTSNKVYKKEMVVTQTPKGSVKSRSIYVYPSSSSLYDPSESDYEESDSDSDEISSSGGDNLVEIFEKSIMGTESPKTGTKHKSRNKHASKKNYNKESKHFEVFNKRYDIDNPKGRKRIIPDDLQNDSAKIQKNTKAYMTGWDDMNE